MWKLANDALPTRGTLARRGVMLDSRCPICQTEESREHLFFVCSWTQQVWIRFISQAGLEMGQNSVEDWLIEASEIAGGPRRNQDDSWRRYIVICWVIWKAMCKLVYENVQPYVDSIMHEIQSIMQEMIQLGPRTRQMTTVTAWSRPPNMLSKSIATRHGVEGQSLGESE